MRPWRWTVVLVPVVLVASAAWAQESVPGQATYEKWCAGCHGVEGRGDGPGAISMLPQPRDFTTGLYQIRSTPSGELPTDDDILRMIDEGMPGSSMPGWKDYLSADERRDLVAYLKSFSRFFEDEEAPPPVDVSGAPGVSEEGIAEGRELYEQIECWKCHGMQGRGNGPSAPTLEDDWDFPVRAADLTEPWAFNGGGSVEAIFTRLMTGLNGTPMPSFADLIDSEFMTREQLWRVAQYVHSLAPETPVVREVVRAALVETLPSGVDDEAWDSVERFYIPLVGQIIEEPRWFVPTVDGAWVQAAHDGVDLALRVTWHDPSQSPDPEWEEWRLKVAGLLNGEDAAIAPADADTVGAIGEAHPADAFAVQFPTTIPEGMKRPYFLMGSAEEPVYLWYWRSDAPGVGERLARGLAEMSDLESEALVGEAVFDEGEWRLAMRRSLQADGDRLELAGGAPIPIALYAWDGSNGEYGTQGAISTWYFLYLDEPTTNAVYALPAAATLLTALLGLVIVARAQRRQRDGAGGGHHG